MTHAPGGCTDHLLVVRRPAARALASVHCWTVSAREHFTPSVRNNNVCLLCFGTERNVLWLSWQFYWHVYVIVRKARVCRIVILLIKCATTFIKSIRVLQKWAYSEISVVFLSFQKVLNFGAWPFVSQVIKRS